MASALLSLTPTFTQGLVLGQLSILLLVGIVLKFLFLDSGPAPPYVPAAYATPSFDNERIRARSKRKSSVLGESRSESAEWFNLVLHQVSFTQCQAGTLMLTYLRERPGRRNISVKAQRRSARRRRRRNCAATDRTLCEQCPTTGLCRTYSHSLPWHCNADEDEGSHTCTVGGPWRLSSADL